jgi:hypothetical protein
MCKRIIICYYVVQRLIFQRYFGEAASEGVAGLERPIYGLSANIYTGKKSTYPPEVLTYV